MIIPTFQCDECETRYDGEPPVLLQGDFASGKAGILLPRRDWTFCSRICTSTWLNRAELRSDTGKVDRMRKFCQPEREPKCK